MRSLLCRQSSPTRTRILTVVALSSLGLLATVVSGEAKPPPPAGRTYFATTLAMPDPFGIDAGCLKFTATRVCFDTFDQSDPKFCGTWTLTDDGDQERGIAFELEWNASGIMLGLDGHLRIDDRGKGSSLGGAARLTSEELELEVNGSFSGTETKRKKCRNLATEFRQVAHQWTAMQCLKGADFSPAANSPYVLPYAVGEAFRIVQSYCEPTGSHRGSYAYDIDMPIGTPIVAARDGVVWMVKDDFEDGDRRGEHANDLFIEHRDGTVAQYAHLQHRSFLVQPGDRVVAGQTVAASGDTGAGPLPHLHFEVYRGKDVMISVPVSFRNAGGPLDERGGLRAGQSYEALPW